MGDDRNVLRQSCGNEEEEGTVNVVSTTHRETVNVYQGHI